MLLLIRTCGGGGESVLGVANAVVVAQAVFTNTSCLIVVIPASTSTCSNADWSKRHRRNCTNIMFRWVAVWSRPLFVNVTLWRQKPLRKERARKRWT